MKIEHIENILSNTTTGLTKWELDTIIYFDRTTNPETLIKFLSRIKFLSNSTDLEKSESEELTHLLNLLEDLDEDECDELLNRSEEDSKDAFIESLARTSAIEVLTSGRLSYETMHTACKLSPNDFILCAKRTQDLINAIQGLVIKGETLSKDVAGA